VRSPIFEESAAQLFNGRAKLGVHLPPLRRFSDDKIGRLTQSLRNCLAHPITLPAALTHTQTTNKADTTQATEDASTFIIPLPHVHRRSQTLADDFPLQRTVLFLIALDFADEGDDPPAGAFPFRRKQCGVQSVARAKP
jgi:hypothetical protein